MKIIINANAHPILDNEKNQAFCAGFQPNGSISLGKSMKRQQPINDTDTIIAMNGTCF
jgi:hypothetical protein